MSEIGYCDKCGRALVEVRERGGFDRTTGQQRIETWRQCPRFPRSWRNVWMGGLGHTSSNADLPLLCRRWM